MELKNGGEKLALTFSGTKSMCLRSFISGYLNAVAMECQILAVNQHRMNYAIRPMMTSQLINT